MHKLNPKFAIECVLRRQTWHKKVYANLWVYPAEQVKSLTRFNLAALCRRWRHPAIWRWRAKNAIASFGLKLTAILMTFSFFNIACYAQDTKKIDEQMKVDNSHIWDFGEVKKNVTLEHDFVYKNESQEVLNIKDVTTSCGCTVSTVKNKSLKPQETTEIKVKFNSKGYVGVVKQFVFVSTDSIENPVIQFIIKADVEK